MYAYIGICNDRSDYWVLDDIEDYCLVEVDPVDYSKTISKIESKNLTCKKKSFKNSAIYNKMKNKDYINSNPKIYHNIKTKIQENERSKKYFKQKHHKVYKLKNKRRKFK